MTVTLPCGHTLPEAEILRLAGQVRSALRTTKSGGRNGGRPATARRCPCGRFPMYRKPKKHECQTVT